MSKKATAWNPGDVQAMIANPVYAGVGSYPRIVTDDQWVQANAKLIEEMGAEAYLRQLLKTLRETFGA